MSDTPHDNTYNDVRIHSKINIGAVVLSVSVVSVPFVAVGLAVLIIWAATHWLEFLAMTPVIIGWTLGLVATAAVILVTALSIKLVGLPGVTLYQRISEARGQRARNKLVATHDNYVVVERRGELELLTVAQEKHAYNYRSGPGTSVVEAGDDKPAALPSPVPTFAQLLNQGVIQMALGRGQMLIGFVFDSTSNEWVARFGSWLDLYSCAIAGVLGSGKTTTALFLLMQALIAGAQMILIDPHLHDPDESLAERLKMFKASMVFEPCDENIGEILPRVRWTMREFKRRKALGIKGPALILVLEEFNACMKLPEVAKEIAELLTCIEQEARKFGIFAILIGQYWSAQGIGGAVVRQCLASALVHRMGDVEQAKKLLGIPKHAQAALQLQAGHHVFKDTQGGYAETVTPAIVDADLLQVAQLIPANIVESRLETSVKPVRNQLVNPLEDLPMKPVENQLETSSETSSESALQALARDIIKLQAQGKQKPEIMQLLLGVQPGPGDKYRQAGERYMAAMKLVHQMIGGE